MVYSSPAFFSSVSLSYQQFFFFYLALSLVILIQISPLHTHTQEGVHVAPTTTFLCLCKHHCMTLEECRGLLSCIGSFPSLCENLILCQYPSKDQSANIFAHCLQYNSLCSVNSLRSSNRWVYLWRSVSVFH